MFESIYSVHLEQYYTLRKSILSESARKHELCYLLRFDRYTKKHLDSAGHLSEDFMIKWVSTLSGKSSSIENEVIVIRQFLKYLVLSGESVYFPPIPKVRDDYVPYIFNDAELGLIFESADNINQKNSKTDPYLAVAFPVILRLLYSCGLRIGETIKLNTSDVDLENGVLKLINTKDNKHRLVPMTPAMTDILSRYYMAMGFSGSDSKWLFPSFKNGSHISDKSVKNIFRQILKDNGIQLNDRKKYERGPCLHCMRHVFAFKSFAKAESEGRHLDDAIPYLSIYLGHESLNETEKYLKFSNEMFPESIDAFGTFMDELMPEVNYEE